MFELSLKGKNILLTGGGRGIGRAIAIAMAEAGASLAIVSRSKDELEETAKLLEKAGSPKVGVYVCDVGNIPFAKEMVHKVISDFGQIDVLMNVAGINFPVRVEDVSEEDWDKVMNINAKAPFFLCQEVGKHMIETGIRGVLINTTSECQDQAEVNTGAYCPSKGALKMTTKLMAAEWGKYGIRVCNLAPCFVNTAMNQPMIHSDDPEIKKFFSTKIARVPLGRYGEPEDIAAAAVFLASDRASFITGSTIICDGGYTCR